MSFSHLFIKIVLENSALKLYMKHRVRFFLLILGMKPRMTGTSSTASSSVAMNQMERVNGWSCPWHPLQFIAWFFLIFFAVVYYGTFVPHLSLEWRPAGYIVSLFYGKHCISYLAASRFQINLRNDIT